MLDKQLARGLLPLVNTFNDDLAAYAEYRITKLHLELENCSDFNRSLQIQGQIRELRRLISLREEVIQDAK
jgi:hypothetical protein